MGYLERLVKRADSGITVPVEAGDARLLIGVPPTSHASSDTLYGVSGVGVYGHAQASATVPVANSGVGSVGIETSSFARGDHYHPVVCSVLQAGRLATGRYIGIGGGVVAEASLFSGEGDLVLQVSSVHADYLTGMVPVSSLPVGLGSGQVAAGDHTHTGYLSISGGTMTGSIVLGSGSVPIIQHQLPTSNYTVALKWYKGGVSQAIYDPQIGQYNTGGGGLGSICILPYATTTDPWGGTVGLYIQNGLAKLDGNTLLTAGNYTDYAAQVSHVHSYAASGSVGGSASTTVSTSSSVNANYSIVGVAVASGVLYFNSDISFNPSTATLTATTFSGSLSGGSVSCSTFSASGTSYLSGNVGVGVASSAYYKLYVYNDQAITVEGTYMGCYVLSRFSSSATVGVRQGIGLTCQAWGVAGTQTLSKLKALDTKAYIITGSHVTDAYAINATVHLDGGTATNLYGLYLTREGSAEPSGSNFGIFQADTKATNVFKGYCLFEGGTNLGSGGGRVRHLKKMIAAGTVEHIAGTDTLVIYEFNNPYGAANITITLPTTAGSVTLGDMITVYNCGKDNVSIASAAAGKIKRMIFDSTPVSSRSFSMFPELAHAIWDGTYWRVEFITLN